MPLGLTDQGFEGWPAKGSTVAPDHESQGQHGRARTNLAWNTEFEMSYAVFEARRGCLVRGIPLRESIEPSDPI